MFAVFLVSDDPRTSWSFHGCLLSRISDMRDEVIGYKSPVLEDNSVAGGQVWELKLSVSRAASPCHVCVHTNR
jgi:hypothetical protein